MNGHKKVPISLIKENGTIRLTGKEKVVQYSHVLRLARHLAPADSQSPNSDLILITSEVVVDFVQSKTRLFLSFQTSQMMRSASEQATFLGMFGRDVVVAHHSIGDEEEGRVDGVSSGSPSQFAISAHT
jgi:hypothetical protein